MKSTKKLKPYTIVAIATPSACSAIGIVRLSGPRAKTILDKIWRPIGAPGPRPRELALGWLLDGDKKIDQAMAVFMPGPRSYSGEDMVELHTHGAPAIIRAALKICLDNGATMAEPGEFTKRAFLNGKLDLAQAEAVVNLVESDNEAMAKLATDQLAGSLSQQIKAMRARLIDLAAHEIASLDFSEEDVSPSNNDNTLKAVKQVRADIERILANSTQVSTLRDGVKVALIGLPNAGKSTLLNHLLGWERSIVTDKPGTTRDTIEENISIDGIGIRLVDTAGLNTRPDEIERLGIERTRTEIRNSDIILLLVEPGREAETAHYLDSQKIFDDDGSSSLAANVVVVWTKSDLKIKPKPSQLGLTGQKHLSVSTLHDKGLKAVGRLIVGHASVSQLTESVVATTSRQLETLKKTTLILRKIEQLLKNGNPSDIVLVDIEEAIKTLGGLTGETANQEVIDAVFANFCIGK